MTDDRAPKNEPPVQGFGYSKRRVALEVSALVGGLAALVLGIIWLAGVLAASLVALVPNNVDVALGRNAWNSMAPAAKHCDDGRVLKYVESLANELTPHFDSSFEFRFRVVDDPQINAFALPGGFVTVNMGLLSKAQTGEEVAAVIAHEMAHVVERHGTKRILRQLGGMAVISMLFGGTDIETPAYVIGGLANTAYDREQESEADRLGRGALMAAGISPLGMVHFFDRIAEQHGSSTPPQLLSTHPDPGNRAQAARQAASNFEPTRTLPSPSGLKCSS